MRISLNPRWRSPAGWSEGGTEHGIARHRRRGSASEAAAFVSRGHRLVAVGTCSEDGRLLCGSIKKGSAE